MSLSPGTGLGPYEILSPLGAGGMGEVYRAKDTRLGRIVAIKVLPSHLSSNPELRQRLEREARAVSSLNHPHICTLYDIGHQDGIDYLIMEFIEGEALSTRLQKGPLATADLLQYSIQIAGALEKAHKQGIIHRDLKPGNIMLTKSGIKLLDFGLAKLQMEASKTPEVSTFPTEQHDLTREGMILGTVQYMAPEQLEGKETDARTDLFAFGCILYEMATGKKAFTGQSRASLITSIMSSEPEPISTIQPLTPPALDRIIKMCLVKDPDERWQNAHDLKGELKWIGESGAQSIPPKTSTVRRRNYREFVAWALLAIALIAGLVSMLRNQQRPTKFANSTRTSILLPQKTALRAAVLSPDGTKLVFAGRDISGRNLLWIRDLDSLNLRPLEGTENPSFPFWSPDNRYIGFFAGGKLKKIEASGGPTQTLSDAPFSRGGSWNRDGAILFSPVTDGPLYRVSASGGVPTLETTLDPARGETTHRWPFFLPDGKHYLYLVASFAGKRDRTGIYVRSLGSKEEKLLVGANSNAAYAPPGNILFFREKNLLAQSFDLKNLQVSGEPLAVAENIQYFPQVFNALFSVSQNGALLYQPQSGTGVCQLIWYDRNGKQLGLVGLPGNQANPRISADGKRIALNIADPETGNNDIWIYESAGTIPTRLTSDPAFESGPNWSPDGSKIVFESIKSFHPDIHQKNSDGTGPDEILVQSQKSKYVTDWSPDGRFILYVSFDATTNLELWTAELGKGQNPTPFIKATFGVSQGQFSADGRWVAYTSNESGQWEVYVTAFPNPGGNWRVSSAGGSEPRWRRDGKELFYMAPDGKIMSVDVTAGTSFEAGAAKPLFQTHRREPVSSTDFFSYDVSADGQRFLVNTDTDAQGSSTLTLLLNWAENLKND